MPFRSTLLTSSTSLFLIGGFFVSPLLTDAIAGGTRGCAEDRPCFRYARQVGNTVEFEFDVVKGWDVYNVRYPVDGGEKQVENRSGRFTFKNVKPNRIYRLSVQGCNKRALQSSRCSPWVEESVTTR